MLLLYRKAKKNVLDASTELSLQFTLQGRFDSCPSWSRVRKQIDQHQTLQLPQDSSHVPAHHRREAKTPAQECWRDRRPTDPSAAD